MDDRSEPAGAAWRGIASGMIALGWLVWALLFLFFWSEDIEVSRRMAILLMSLLVLAGVMSVIWVPWSMRFAPEEGYSWWMPGFSWRVVVSVVAAIGLLLAGIYWLWLHGGGYTFCQSCVVIIVVLLVIGGVMTVFWAGWGMRQSRQVAVEVKGEVVEGISKALDEEEEEG